MLTIILDVDGVVADLMTPWLNEYNKDYGDTLNVSDIQSWNAHSYTKPECGTKFYNYIEDPTLYDVVLPTSPDVLEFVSQIKKEGHRVIYVTTSTLGSSGAKYKWLKKWSFLDSMNDYVEATDKNLIKADILVDDKYENAQRWYLSGGLPVLFRQPWNEWADVPYYHTNNWDVILQAVLISSGVLV